MLSETRRIVESGTRITCRSSTPGREVRTETRFESCDGNSSVIVAGLWSPEEEDALHRTVAEVCAASKIAIKDTPNKPISWSTVVTKMGGQRNALECREKWCVRSGTSELHSLMVTHRQVRSSASQNTRSRRGRCSRITKYPFAIDASGKLDSRCYGSSLDCRESSESERMESGRLHQSP